MLVVLSAKSGGARWAPALTTKHGQPPNHACHFEGYWTEIGNKCNWLTRNRQGTDQVGKKVLSQQFGTHFERKCVSIFVQNNVTKKWQPRQKGWFWCKIECSFQKCEFQSATMKNKRVIALFLHPGRKCTFNSWLFGSIRPFFFPKRHHLGQQPSSGNGHRSSYQKKKKEPRGARRAYTMGLKRN